MYFRHLFEEVGTIKKLCILPLLALCILCAGCTVKGNDLPDGMDETEVLLAGVAVMNDLCDGDYDAVYDALREDVREETSAEALREVMENAAAGLGVAGDVTDTLVTGVTDADEPHAIAVIRRKFEKKSLYFRVAFDTDLQLIGLQVTKK